MKFKSAEIARYFTQALRRFFSDLAIEWQAILREARTLGVPLSVYRVIVEASVSTRVNCMSSEHYREIDRIAPPEYSFRQSYAEIRTMVVQFVQEHREFLINASTMLELALWKAVMNDSLLQQRPYVTDDRSTIREEIRGNGGQKFQVVIPNVLSFL